MIILFAIAGSLIVALFTALMYTFLFERPNGG